MSRSTPRSGRRGGAGFGAAIIAILLVVAGACSSSAHSAAPTSSTTVDATSTTNSAVDATTSTTVPATDRVDVFGDSLMVQTNEALKVQGRAHGLNVTVAAYYGLAPCDLDKPMLQDLVRPPRVLVIAFSGNNITPCMARNGQPLTGAAYYAKYRRDVGTVVAVATAHKVPVLLVGPPRLIPLKNKPDRVVLDAMYRALAAAYPGARYLAVAPVITPHGFTVTLPCDAGESAALGCHGGTIVVRAPDGIHFDEPRVVPCPSGHDVCRYSAGAHREANLILGAVATMGGLQYRPAPATAGVPIDTTTNG